MFKKNFFNTRKSSIVYSEIEGEEGEIYTVAQLVSEAPVTVKISTIIDNKIITEEEGEKLDLEKLRVTEFLKLSKNKVVIIAKRLEEW